MNEYEYLVIGRDPKSAIHRVTLMRHKPFDTHDEALRYAMDWATMFDVQIVPIVRHPSRSYVAGPYPMCRTPALCKDAGYCRRDPACNE